MDVTQFGDSTPLPVDEVEAMDDAEEEKAEKLPTADEHVEGYAPESVNLVATLTEDEQKKLADTVWEEWDMDWRSGEKHRQTYANIIKLYSGLMPPKEEGMAQIHLGIIVKAINRVHARLYDQQLPSNNDFFGCRPMDATDVERAARVAKHLCWQIMTQVPNYIPNIDRLILQWLLYGSAFTYVYWDPIANKPCHEVCATEDIVLPYARTSTDPNLADMPRITRVIRKYRWGVEGIDALAESGYYDKVNCDAIFADKDGDGVQSDDADKSEQIQETVDRVAGVERPTGDDKKGGPRVLLEQHRWSRLPGSKEYRPVIATIDKLTKKLVCLKLRESEDQQDQARYNREKAANDAEHAAAMEQFQAEMALYLQNVPAFPQPTITPLPLPGEVTATPAPMPGATDSTLPGVEMPPAPMEPIPPDEPQKPRMVPINSFTHYVCLPNPEGVYGFGIGFLLEGNNIVADAISSIMVQAGKLSNTATGIRSRQSKLSGGEFKIKPGEFIEVDIPPEQLDKVLFPIKFPPPEPQLMNFVELMMRDADDTSGAGDILSGEVGGSNETATTTQIRISQALAAISIQGKRFTFARTCEAQKFARLNSVHLSDREYFPVVSPYKMGPPENGEIARIDYLQDSDIYVTADPRMASKPQRIQEATDALQSIISGPLAALPQFFPLVIAAYRNLYIAMDRPDLVAALDQAAAMPPMMPAPGVPGSAPGPGAPPGQPPGPEGGAPGGGPPRPEPMPPPVPNAGPTPQNGAVMS